MKQGTNKAKDSMTKVKAPEVAIKTGSGTSAVAEKAFSYQPMSNASSLASPAVGTRPAGNSKNFLSKATVQ